ncbi:lectin C-type domain protein [Ancylostoma ceylanicum]|nr:lectin C-type domain protein [Ancylostoma ceylanicum]
MKTACINVAWLIAILGWNQFAPASACSFVKINGNFKATLIDSTRVGGIEENCLRMCYEHEQCKFVQFLRNVVDNSRDDCFYYANGKDTYPEGRLTYELRRDETLLYCERKVTINLSGNGPESTTTTQDNHGAQGAVFEEEEMEPPQPKSEWKYFKVTNMCYRAYTEGGAFDESRRWCNKEGGELTSIHSKQHNTFLKELSDEYVRLIGLRLGSANGATGAARTKNWTDGSAVDYENWSSGFPTASPQFCTIVSHPVCLHPISCAAQKRIQCE